MSSWVCKSFTRDTVVSSGSSSFRRDARFNQNGALISAPFLFALSLVISPLVKAESNFPYIAPTFDQYIEDAYAHIKPKSLPRTDAEIRLNLPFQLAASPAVSYRGRFLLFHGLNDSPYIWRDIAKEIAARGFDVRAILFEGHGSTPVEMLDVSYKSWLASARQHKADWQEADVPLYLGGFSLGGVIATLMALETPEDIAGLLLVSPAYHSKLNKYLRWSGLYSKFKPWVFGGMIIEDNPIKYNSIPINSVSQYYKTTQKLKRLWRDRTLDMPVLLLASANDSVVDVDYTQRLFNRRFTHPAKKMVLYHDPNNASSDGGALSSKHLARSNGAIEARNANFPALRVINQSHLSLINRPENDLFGESGRILVCNGNEYPIFMACMRARSHWYGAQHTTLPAQATDEQRMARTTYNPDFSAVLDRFDEAFMHQ